MDFLSRRSREEKHDNPHDYLQLAQYDFSHLTDENDRPLSMEGKVVKHREGGSGTPRYGVPLTCDYLLACYFAGQEGIIYELKIPNYLVKDVNKILKEADIPDPALGGGGDATREFLVWHLLDKKYIAGKTNYPLLRNIDLMNFQDSELFIFLDGVSKKQVPVNSWRDWNSKEYLDVDELKI